MQDTLEFTKIPTCNYNEYFMIFQIYAYSQLIIKTTYLIWDRFDICEYSSPIRPGEHNQQYVVEHQVNTLLHRGFNCDWKTNKKLTNQWEMTSSSKIIYD